MDPGLATVVGMSIAYIASFLGLGLAWRAWHQRADDADDPDRDAGDEPRGGRS